MIHTSGITAYEHVKYLADSIGARPSGSKQASDAVKYVCENFEDYGFELYKDTFKPLVYTHKGSFVEIQNSKKIQIKAIPLMFSGTTNSSGICREIVYVKDASFFSKDLNDKIVLVKEPPGNLTLEFHKLVEMAKKFNVAGLLIHSISGSPKCYSLAPSKDNPPIVYISSESGFLLLSELVTHGRCYTKITVLAETVESKFSQNVRAIWNSQYDEERMILCAHYDTVIDSPGANDNASGMACLIETARALSKKKLNRTVEFVFFDAEEPYPYCLGSRRYVEKHKEYLNKIKCAIVMDQVGVGTKVDSTPSLKCLYRKGYYRGSVIQTPERLDNAIFKVAKKLGVSLKKLKEVGLSDHVPFLLMGVDASFLRWMDDPYRHTPDDKTINVDPKKLEIMSSIAANSIISFTKLAKTDIN